MWQYNHNELQHFGVLGMKWGGSRAQRTQTQIAKQKAKKDIKESITKWKGMKAKGKIDSAYKESPEYQKAREERGKQVVTRLLIGKSGRRRIATLKNTGQSSFNATKQAVVERVIKNMAATVIMRSVAKAVVKGVSNKAAKMMYGQGQ